jgi:molybdopterin-guanine dinucleotide biosynthesis protein B
LEPYVVRFVSARSGVGKTTLISEVSKRLLGSGLAVAVIKHVHGDVALEEKDSRRFLEVGVREVVVSSRHLTIIYSREVPEDLVAIVRLLRKPLVLVEGFKNSNLGDKVVVAGSLDEVAELMDSSTIAVVLSSSEEVRQVSNVLTTRDADRLAKVIAERAVEHVLRQLPGLNCGYCGYSTCRGLALHILQGESRACPRVLDVKLTVDGLEVPLNPFVRNLINLIIESFLKVLKGVPERYSTVELRISR